MYQAIFKLGCFLRLIDDHDGRLSLTSIGVIVCLLKLLLAEHTSVPDLGALMLTLLAYNARKVMRSREDAASSEASADATGRLNGLAAEVAKWDGKLQALVGTIAMGSRR